MINASLSLDEGQLGNHWFNMRWRSMHVQNVKGKNNTRKRKENGKRKRRVCELKDVKGGGKKEI